jgi:hypothetical protein
MLLKFINKIILKENINMKSFDYFDKIPENDIKM